MKKILAALICAASVAGANAQTDTIAADTIEGFVFTNVITIPVTSVKDQNKSGTCWCFAGTSFYENEIRRAGGDSLDLSEMFTVRHCYLDKADKYVRMNGAIALSPGGSPLDVPHVWANYGAVPEEVYPGLNYGEDKHDHSELQPAIHGYVQAVNKKPGQRISTAWKQGLEGILDAYFGPVPETFEYNGRTYTPQSFAASLGISPDNYIALTSYTHHPFYQPFALEVMDNWLWGEYMNVPMEDLKAITDNALENGYTVLWAADVSEPGFKWKKGVALMPVAKDENLEGSELARWVKLSDNERNSERYDFSGPVDEITVTQEMRQTTFDRQETTDDHAMEIVGTAVDQNGKRYYKVKNSWDTNHIYDGFFYVSEPYFLAKTVSLYVNKAAVPASISRKYTRR